MAPQRCGKRKGEKGGIVSQIKVFSVLKAITSETKKLFRAERVFSECIEPNVQHRNVHLLQGWLFVLNPICKHLSMLCVCVCVCVLLYVSVSLSLSLSFSLLLCV